MPSQEEKDQASPTNATGDIESPYLAEALFVDEIEADWEPRLSRLESEGSFGAVFESAIEQGRPAVDQEDGGLLPMEETKALYESSAVPQLVIGEEDYERPNTESRPEYFPERLEPSGEEEDSTATEDFHMLDHFQDDEVDQQLQSPSDFSHGIADALRKSDWAGALKLAIEEGWRNDDKLTNLIFFAQHPEVAGGKLDPKHPEFTQLSRKWNTIRDREVWTAIQKSAENTPLAVVGKEVAADHRQFWGKSGKRFKSLIEDAAKQVDLNPGLLAANLLAEADPKNKKRDYLTSEKVRSYNIGVDDFYDMRNAIARRVSAYAKISWDQKQKPVEHPNDAKKPRLVKTIKFDSGPDALLASAVYLKYCEARLREEAAKLNGDFDKLPLETRWALIRMAFNAGVAGATKRLVRALNGEDILVRKNLPRKAYQTERNATIHTARALHLSEWTFGLSMKPRIQPEIQSSSVFDDEGEIDEHEFEDELHDEKFDDAELEDELDTGVISREIFVDETEDLQIESEILGTNDMTGVSNSLDAPHRWICRLDIKYEISPWKGSPKLSGSGIGSGTLIGPRHVLTAAHNVRHYDPNGKNYLRATSIKVTPAHDGSTAPPLATIAADLSRSHVHARWKVSRRVGTAGKPNPAGEIETNQYDYALLILKTPSGLTQVKALGGPLGCWEYGGSRGIAHFRRLDPKILESNVVFVAGYGNDDCVKAVRLVTSNNKIALGSQLKASGRITLSRQKHGNNTYVSRSMAHDVDTCGGQSGAAVYLERNGIFDLVGIHTGSVELSNGSRMNHAVRITEELIQQIRTWLSQK